MAWFALERGMRRTDRQDLPYDGRKLSQTAIEV